MSHMWVGGHRRRKRPAERRTGLTGDPDIPEPGSDEPPALRGRFANLRQSIAATVAAVPKVLRLVWSASRWSTLGLATATILGGITPALTAYTAKLLIDAVVAAIQAGPVSSDATETVTLPFLGAVAISPVGVVVALAIVQFGIFALNSFLSTLRNISQQLLQERVTLTIQLQVMRHAAALDLAFFEDAKTYDLLQRTETGLYARPLMMVSGVFGLIQTAITFTSMVFLLIGLSPFLAIVAFIAPLPAFIADTRYGWRGYNLARWASPL